MARTRSRESQLKALQKEAKALAGQIKAQFSMGIINSWDDVFKRYGLDVQGFREQEFNRSSLELFLMGYKASIEEKFDGELDRAKTAKATKTTGKVERLTYAKDLHKAVLTPSQQRVSDIIIKKLFIDGTSIAIMNNGETGWGKTWAALATAKKIINEGWHIKAKPMCPYRILIVTKKSVVKKWKRVAYHYFGLEHGKDVYITNYESLTAGFGKTITYTEMEKQWDQEEVEVIKMGEPFVPYFIIWDEHHSLKNIGSRRSRFAQAMIGHKDCYQLFMSATPFVTVNNAMVFGLAAGLKWMDNPLTRYTWPKFARSLTPEPDKADPQAAKTLRALLDEHIVNGAPMRLKVKAYNRVMMIPFKDKEQESVYQETWDRYQEFCERCGKDTPEGWWQIMVATNQFTRSSEVIRVPQLEDLSYEQYIGGEKAVIVGVRYQDTLRNTVIGLVKRGVPRDQISVIWGGATKVKPEDLLTSEQIMTILAKQMGGEPIDPIEKRRMKITLKYDEDRIEKRETEAEQRERYRLFSELDLHKQSMIARQKNIDNFQTGKSRICIMTLAAGGTGLDLDDQHPNTLPRVGFFSPPWSAEELMQALGRGLRVKTKSDIHQFIVYFKGTIEERRVAPVLDLKLRSLSKALAMNENFMEIVAKNTHEAGVDPMAIPYAPMEADVSEEGQAALLAAHDINIDDSENEDDEEPNEPNEGNENEREEAA